MEQASSQSRPSQDAELRDACEVWQSGRDGGSSPIRAAARNLTGVRHYFTADFIEKYESDALTDPDAIRRAQVLLKSLAESPLLTAAEWAEQLGVDSTWTGRGIKSGPQDDQISAQLSSGSVAMPLWGTTFDPEVASSFGSGFTFALVGRFPAVPAWVHSGIKDDEQELICGGHYVVESMTELPHGGTEVHLKFERLVEPI